MTTPTTPTPEHPTQPPYYGKTPPYGTPYGQSAYYGGDTTVLLGSLDVFRMIRVLRKKWFTVLLVIAFSGVAAVYYIFTTAKIYRASSLVELSVRRPRIMTQQAAVIEDQRRFSIPAWRNSRGGN